MAKKRLTLGNLCVGQEVENQVFALNIQGSAFSTRISGKVLKLFETKNAGWATIQQKDGSVRLVCLQ